MPATPSLPAGDLPPGTVRGLGEWAVGNADGALFAVSRRCRHQFADLAAGSLGAEGCLVCPWHQSRYDIGTGAMVSGPRGVFGYHGPTPGYSGLVRALGRFVPLRVRRVVRRGPDVVVEG